MTELNDETIDKIANAVKQKHISDRWKDPKKAEQWGGAGWWVAIGLGVILFLVCWLASMYGDMQSKHQEGIDTYEKISLANMDCESLKKTLLDLEASEVVYVPSNAVQKQITARCGQ